MKILKVIKASNKLLDILEGTTEEGRIYTKNSLEAEIFFSQEDAKESNDKGYLKDVKSKIKYLEKCLDILKSNSLDGFI